MRICKSKRFRLFGHRATLYFVLSLPPLPNSYVRRDGTIPACRLLRKHISTWTQDRNRQKMTTASKRPNSNISLINSMDKCIFHLIEYFESRLIPSVWYSASEIHSPVAHTHTLVAQRTANLSNEHIESRPNDSATMCFSSDSVSFVSLSRCVYFCVVVVFFVYALSAS